MGQTPDRLERLITAEAGECRVGDVEAKLADLDELLAIDPAVRAAALQALSTLGDGTRYDLVRLLVAADRELCVCEITPLFDVSDSAISHALADCRDAGLLTRRKDGTWRHYAATDLARSIMAGLEAAGSTSDGSTTEGSTSAGSKSVASTRRDDSGGGGR